VNKNGAMVDVEVQAPHHALEKEAIRVMNSIPKMLAAEKANGEKVTVKYSLPITFNVR